jgi:hypothetical protein
MKKIWLFMLSFLLCGFVFAQTIVLKNGSAIKGNILDDNSDFVEIETAVFGKIKIDRSEIKSVNYDIYSIKLKNGTVLKSKILQKTDTYIKIILSGSEITIPMEDVLSMEIEKLPKESPSAHEVEPQSPTPTQSVGAISGLGTVSSAAIAAAASGKQISQIPAGVAPATGSNNFSPSLSGTGENAVVSPSASAPNAGRVSSAGQNISVVDLTAGTLVSESSGMEDLSQMKYVITLKNGRQIEASILDMDSDSVRILTDEGEKTLLRTGILSIVAR